VIQSRWVYAVKTDPTAAEKEKSRIVVKQKGVNYSETNSPVMEFSNFLIICQYARAKKLSLWRFDISTAFLHADLKEDVYMDIFVIVLDSLLLFLYIPCLFLTPNCCRERNIKNRGQRIHTKEGH
jgi:hypothetical protein